MFTSAGLEAKKYFTIVTTNASFCLFISAFVFASNSGHFRINDFLLFFTPLLLLNYFLFNLFLFLQKSGGGGGLKPPPPAPPSARSLKRLFCLCNNFLQPATIDFPQVDLTILSERSLIRGWYHRNMHRFSTRFTAML